MNTNLLLQAGRLENESNQMVILAVNSGLRNRCEWEQSLRLSPHETPHWLISVVGSIKLRFRATVKKQALTPPCVGPALSGPAQTFGKLLQPT